jgi:hypothetical protein
LKKQRKNIELLLIAIVFTVFVCIALGITLATSHNESAEKQPSENSEDTNVVLHVEKTNTPIQAVRDPKNTTAQEEVEIPVKTLINTVPFTSQAPTGVWSDDQQQNACEEASSLMAYWWAKGKKPASSQDSLEQILAITKYEEETFGTSNDTNPTDTVTRIFKDYFKYAKADAVEDISLQDIIQEIMKGHLVILPMNGITLANPHYTQPGPERHMLLIIGYDAKTKEFITNDSGTKFGAGYRYKQDTVFAAIREYPTGDHLPILGPVVKSMIVVSK